MSRLNPKIFRGRCARGCGEPIFSASWKARFCSVSCASKSQIRSSANTTLCITGCGKKAVRAGRKYCSFRCQQDYQLNQRFQQLEAGIYAVVNPNQLIRKYLIAKYGEKCSRCGWNQRHDLTKRVPVEVEHIDGNWENNDLSNLTLLCPNCHSLTYSFRGLNRGKGRPNRLGGRANPIGTGSLHKGQKSSAVRQRTVTPLEP